MKKFFLLIVCTLVLNSVSFAQNYQLLYELPSGAELVSEFNDNFGYKEMFDYDGDDILEIVYENEGKVTILDGANFLLIAEISLDEIGMESFDTEESGFFDIDGDGVKEFVFDSVFLDGIKIIDINDNTMEFELPRSFIRGCIDMNNDGFPELIVETEISFENYIYQIWGNGGATKVNSNSNPNAYKLSQNYPNPFNPTTTIQYSVQLSGNVQIKVYNSAGQLVRELVDEQQSIGEYSVIWDGKDESGMYVSSGQYYYQLKVGDFISSKKMIMLK